MIHVVSVIIGPEEHRAVKKVLESGMLAQGPKVAELEVDWAKHCGTSHAFAVSSGTSALHTALAVAGVGPGDEVITTSFSFIATINPIIMLGAKPVLVDIDPVTFNLDPALVAKAVTPKTKAILPVHLYGQPCDYAEIAAIAKKYKLKVIEDACQSVGAEYNGKMAGSLGDLGCFSLYATKNIMSGEGGMVTTNNEQYAEAIKRFRQHGMTGPYEYAELGYNYRMTDLQAAIAVEQLKKADAFTAARIKNAAALTKGLERVRGLVLPKIAPNRTHVFHQYTVRVTKDFPLTRQQLMEALKAREIGSGIYYPKAMHEYPHIAEYGYQKGDFPEAERAGVEVLSLPVHPKITAADIKKIVTAIKDIARGA